MIEESTPPIEVQNLAAVMRSSATSATCMLAGSALAPIACTALSRAATMPRKVKVSPIATKMFAHQASTRVSSPRWRK
jgi:hypothetical protein